MVSATSLKMVWKTNERYTFVKLFQNIKNTVEKQTKNVNNHFTEKELQMS